ncbi:hypothetical protein JR316_0004048 [Psilocybe cubensis]|uniref:BTB domain-containing protein n=2 Tax=Psilocybe cubensis TaxID=181762 RepID=A0A8H7Y3M6_PSICU|nr:hypothetical protein JR316_0004048 [Psilocybe cubensis]KAH9484566.1 hypothetical protein JR316_0004048 [Psilocybe cubensis]
MHLTERATPCSLFSLYIFSSFQKDSTINMVHEVIIKKHPIYWFEDGSLILDVANHRYKVHHTLVARHSKFFSAATTLAKEEGGRDTKQDGKEHDGATQNILVGSSPLIHTHVILEPERQVHPEDIEALLQHLYHDV